MFTTAIALGLAAVAADPAGTEMVRDPHFQTGFEVCAPAPGRKVVIGKLVRAGATEPPVWTLAQWSSRFPLGTPTATVAAGGAARFANQAKEVIVAPAGHEAADLVLSVNGSAEYGTRARRQGEPWVHLLVEQSFNCPLTLHQMSAVPVRLEARLRSARKVDTADYTPQLHAAQFLMYLTVQNLSRESAGYGDYYWFGIPIYDDRWPKQPRAAHGDKGTGKLIYTPGSARFSSESTHGGTWVTFAADVLPDLLDGLRLAWQRGFLPDSQNLADYRLGGMNLGWEVPGIFDVSCQVRGLSVRVVPTAR